jgi:hypothetical protein
MPFIGPEKNSITNSSFLRGVYSLNSVIIVAGEIAADPWGMTSFNPRAHRLPPAPSILDFEK